MITKNDVERFLKDFRVKAEVFGIRFRDERGKNSNALLELEITPLMREDIIKSLTPDDYSEGPNADKFNSIADLWIFGKELKGIEIYIKISMGRENSNTICISFHPAEHPMSYPFKSK